MRPRESINLSHLKLSLAGSAPFDGALLDLLSSCDPSLVKSDLLLGAGGLDRRDRTLLGCIGLDGGGLLNLDGRLTGADQTKERKKSSQESQGANSESPGDFGHGGDSVLGVFVEQTWRDGKQRCSVLCLGGWSANRILTPELHQLQLDQVLESDLALNFLIFKLLGVFLESPLYVEGLLGQSLSIRSVVSDEDVVDCDEEDTTVSAHFTNHAF